MVTTGAVPCRGAYDTDRWCVSSWWVRTTGRWPAGPSNTRGLGSDVGISGLCREDEEGGARGFLACSRVNSREARRVAGTSKMSKMGGMVSGEASMTAVARAADEECTLRMEWTAARTAEVACCDIFEVDRY